MEDVVLNQLVFVLFPAMVPYRISGPESFIAEAARDDNALEMVCFNVIFYVPPIAFLSTRFAPISKTKSIGSSVLAFFHQRFHPFIKLAKIHRKVPWNSKTRVRCRCSVCPKLGMFLYV